MANFDNGGSVVITRTFDAPVGKVWTAWTESVALKEWWGPRGFTNSSVEVDVREGGNLRVEMVGPDAVKYPMTGKYSSVVQSKKLVMESSPLDPTGNPLFTMEQDITLNDVDGKTELTVAAKVLSQSPDAKRYLDGYEQGMNETLDRLGEYLAK